MPAPPSNIVNAMRNGTHRRHVFFKMEHPDGDVFAWDGVRNFTLSGDTYLGVAGMASITGVSDSGDIQNHEVLVTLNGVGLAALSEIEHDVRGCEAEILVAWLAEDGSVLGPRTVFVGKGDILKTKVGDTEYAVVLKLRAPLAEWNAAPRAYYTDSDQRRRVDPTDTGFSFVKLLENATVAGWSKDEEATGGQVIEFGFIYTQSAGVVVSFGNDTREYICGGLRASDDGAIIGDTVYGPNVYAGTFKGGSQGLYSMSSFRYTQSQGQLRPRLTYLEEDTGAILSHTALGSPIGAGGVPGYLDVFGDARTAGALLMTRNELASGRLRKQGTIAGDGSATATIITRSTIHPYAGSFNLNNDNWSARVYCNKNGLLAERNGSNISLVTGMASNVRSYGANYVEAGTGNAVTWNGSDQLICNGVTCKLSTTGVVLTNTGARVVLAADPTNAFLRVWT